MDDSRGLLHVNLNVSNLERSIRFYCEGLGLLLVSDSSETIDRGDGPSRGPHRDLTQRPYPDALPEVSLNGLSSTRPMAGNSTSNRVRFSR